MNFFSGVVTAVHGGGERGDYACITMRDYVIQCAGLHVWYARCRSRFTYLA